MELAYILFGFLVGFFTMLGYTGYVKYQRAKRAYFHTKSMLDELQEKIIYCKMEFVDNEIFIYRKKDSLFLARSKDLKDLDEQLQKMHPDKYFDVDEDQIEEAKFISKLNEREEKGKTV